MRFKLTIEYAGTRYSGWQIQTNARTVQGELSRVIRDVTGENEFELYGSGRTDAGVHALAQIAHLEVRTTLPPESLRRRLNDGLPADINVLRIEKVPHRFHARHDAIVRSYLEHRYDIRAPELTTEEFLQVASRAPELSSAQRDQLSQFLERCDRVKFAGYRPDSNESIDTLAAARAFVEETRLREDTAGRAAA